MRHNLKCMIDGEILEYDICFNISNRDKLKDPSKLYPDYNYLGIGTIYSIDGVRQSDYKSMYYFFK